MKKELIDFVIIYRDRYFGVNFDNRDVQEVDFDTAYGKDFFDWSNNICIASERNKLRYTKMRGRFGTGFGNIVGYVAGLTDKLTVPRVTG